MDLKAKNERVRHCVEDTDNMDEPTAKCGKYITATLQNSVHRLASMLSRMSLLGMFFNYFSARLNQSQLHNCAIYYVMQ